MLKKLLCIFFLGIFLFGNSFLQAQTKLSFDKYHTPDEVQQMLKKLTGKNTKIHTIAKSPGGQAINVLEIGTNLKDAPAIFVGANFEGNVPLATEGALSFVQLLQDSVSYTSNVKWYIMPQPNPDAADGYFAEIKSNRTVNQYPINDDGDNLVNEDGYDDLNNDGFITQMRVKDSEGSYVVSKHNPLLMEKANPKKGERGKYKIYTEGLDNDNDGKYNEDAEGGINVGISFPHIFPRGKSGAGLFSGQSPEVYGIMRFIFDHPEIAMVYTLGTSDFCLTPPKGGRKGGANLEKIKVPDRYGKRFDIDTKKTYTMDEIIEIFKAFVPAGMEVTPSMVASFLGLGAAVNPQADDLEFYKKYSEEYKKYLKEKKFNTEVLAPSPAKDGSFELWAYYHLGVPSFSMRLFSVPKVKEEKKSDEKAPSLEEVEKMNSDDFIALGKDKIESFLKANKAPERFKAENVMKMMESGQLTPKQMVGMMKQMPKPEKEGELSEKDKALLAYSEKEWNGKGYAKWEKLDHPTLGEVEIGGYIPYLETTPKAALIDSLTKAQLPWLLKLSTQLPEFEIESYKVTQLGTGIYKLEICVVNNGELAYPISMGDRNKQPAPVILALEGDYELLEGLKRTPVGTLGANQVKKVSWLIKTDNNAKLTAKLQSVVFADDVEQINIGG